MMYHALHTKTMQADPPECATLSTAVGELKDRLVQNADSPITRMDELWRQENTTGKQCAGLGRGRLKGTWLGKSGLSPCPGMTTVVTEGKYRALEHRWAWRQCGTGRALGSESGACI